MIETKIIQERILDAALAEFGQKGYSHASTNQIYPVAEVSKGYIFKLFKSKSNLFYNVFMKSLEEMISLLEKETFYELSDPIEKTIDVMLWKVNYAKNHPNETNVLLEGITNPPEEVQMKIHSHLKDLTKLSIQNFFKDISMERIDPRYTQQDVIEYLTIASEGLQSTIIHRGLTLDGLEKVRDKSIDYFKTVLKGMEKK